MGLDPLARRIAPVSINIADRDDLGIGLSQESVHVPVDPVVADAAETVRMKPLREIFLAMVIAMLLPDRRGAARSSRSFDDRPARGRRKSRLPWLGADPVA